MLILLAKTISVNILIVNTEDEIRILRSIFFQMYHILQPWCLWSKGRHINYLSFYNKELI